MEKAKDDGGQLTDQPEITNKLKDELATLVFTAEKQEDPSEIMRELMTKLANLEIDEKKCLGNLETIRKEITETRRQLLQLDMQEEIKRHGPAKGGWGGRGDSRAWGQRED